VIDRHNPKTATPSTVVDAAREAANREPDFREFMDTLAKEFNDAPPTGLFKAWKSLVRDN